MIEVRRTIPARPDQVFAVLADGWSYAAWVVGNSHIRNVDRGWPTAGTRIHHSAGLWPLQLPDVTVVRAVAPGRMLELEVRLWVLGTALVRLTLTSVAEGTEVVMGEQATGGPLRLLPDTVQALGLRPRNREALARLADIVVGRATGR